MQKGSPILSRINQLLHNGTYFLKIYCNIPLPSTLRPSYIIFLAGLPVKILKAFLPSSILATCSAHINLLDVIILTYD